MKADLLEPCGACEVMLDSNATVARSPLRALLARFPAVSQAALSLVDQAIVSGASFVTAMIIARTTSQETMGMYYLIASIVIVAVGVQEHIIAAPYIIYSKRRSGNELAVYNGSVWLHHFLTTAAGVIVLLAAIGVVSIAGSSPLASSLWVLLIAGPLMLLREWIRRFAFSNLKIAAALAVDSVVAVLQLAGLLWLARSGSLSVFGIFAVMGGACLIASLGWLIFAAGDIKFQRDRVRPDWRSNWLFGKWTVRSYLVGNTTQYVMPWIVNLAVSTAAAGVLGACSTLINLANLFLTSIDRILTPRAAQAFATGGVHELRRVLKWAAIALLPALALFCLVVFAVGSRVAEFVYGEQYAGTGLILSVLSLSVLANGVGTLVGNGLWAIDQPRSNFVADLCCLVVTLGSAIALVTTLDTLGAALALLAGTSVAAVVRTITFWLALAAFEDKADSPVTASMTT
jgi:O-antigen/teichoic acid export membrane protein